MAKLMQTATPCSCSFHRISGSHILYVCMYDFQSFIVKESNIEVALNESEKVGAKCRRQAEEVCYGRAFMLIKKFSSRISRSF